MNRLSFKVIDKTNLALELSFIHSYILTTIHSLEYLPWKIVVSSNLALRTEDSTNASLDYFLSTLFNHHHTPKSNKQPQLGCSLKKWTSATFPPLSLYFQDFFSQQRSSRPNSRSCAMQSCCGKFANWGRKWKLCGFPSSSVFQACLLPGLAAPLSHPNVVHIFHV